MNSKQRAGFVVLLLVGSVLTVAQTNNAKIDVARLIASAQHNGETMSKRVFDYSWKSKTTVRQFKRSRLISEVEQDHEVYPAPGVLFVVQKLIGENGLPLSAKRAAKEQKRVDAELIRAEIATATFGEEVRPAAKGSECGSFGIWTVLNGRGGKETSLGISDFLCYATFFSAHIERKDGRETVVLRFHPRDGLAALPTEKAPFAKLVGIAWIDLKDKIVTHIEAWPVAYPRETGERNLPPGGAPIIFDDMRLANGMWVRRARYIDTRTDPLAFNGLNLEWKQEFSGYQRYFTESKDYKDFEEPRPSPTPESPEAPESPESLSLPPPP